MSGWTAKRFWKEATVAAVTGGYSVLLDGRSVKTPAKSALIMPTAAMAAAVAAEWQAQEGVIKPDTMPCTRSANSAIDKVATQFDEVAGLIAAYGASDLLCYRATEPPRLVDRQAAGWNPILAWAAEHLGAPLTATAGVMHIPQPEASLARLQDMVFAFTPFELAALHDLVAISGSLVLGLAVTTGHIGAEEAWALSRIDETWQNEIWGVDEEAAALEAGRHEALLHAARFFALCH